MPLSGCTFMPMSGPSSGTQRSIALAAVAPKVRDLVLQLQDTADPYKVESVAKSLCDTAKHPDVRFAVRACAAGSASRFRRSPAFHRRAGSESAGRHAQAATEIANTPRLSAAGLAPSQIPFRGLTVPASRAT